MRKWPVCAQCGDEIRSGSKYYVFLSDTYCQECGEEWMKDELAERFDDLKDELTELLGGYVVVNA